MIHKNLCLIHKIWLKTPYFHNLAYHYMGIIWKHGAFLAEEITGEKETEGYENIANIH